MRADIRNEASMPDYQPVHAKEEANLHSYVLEILGEDVLDTTRASYAEKLLILRCKEIGHSIRFQF